MALVPLPPFCPWEPTFNPEFEAGEYCESIARIECDRKMRCCEMLPANYDECLADYRRGVCGAHELQERIDGGALVLDLPLAREYLRITALAQSCSAPALPLEFLQTTPASRNPLFSAGSAPGEPCFDGLDCIHGGCAQRPLSCEVCPFPRLRGEPCESHLDCDTLVDACVESAAAEGKTCQPLPVDGELCEGSRWCAAGHECVRWMGNVAEARCERREPEGASCVAWSDYCQDGYLCIDGKCAVDRPSFSTDVGSQCWARTQPYPNSWGCGPRLYCSMGSYDGECQPLVKDECVEGECGPLGYCQSDGGCLLKKPLGDECNEASECGPGLTCAASRCERARGPEGTSCSGDLGCAWPFRCIDGQCGRGRPPGTACVSREECSSRSCEDGVCQDFAVDGDYCGYALCESGSRCRAIYAYCGYVCDYSKAPR